MLFLSIRTMLRFSWRALNWKAFKLEAENKMLYYKKNPINVFFLLDNNLKPLNVWIGPITSAALRTGPCCLCLVLFTWYDSGRSHQAWSEFCSPLYQNTKISCVSGVFFVFPPSRCWFLCTFSSQFRRNRPQKLAETNRLCEPNFKV